jgi:hypothetical protein
LLWAGRAQVVLVGKVQPAANGRMAMEPLNLSIIETARVLGIKRSKTYELINAGALETVERWLAEPSFEKLRPQLEQMRTRLERFVGQ